MNIHPLFVHFPIALLTIYALLEFITPFIKNSKYRTGVEHTKGVFVIFGAAALIPTLIAGDIAADLINGGDIVEIHEMFAQFTSVVFYILAIAYLLPVIESVLFLRHVFTKYKWLNVILKLWHKLASVVMYPIVKISLAIIGFVLLIITGALGSGIVYGPGFDPIIGFVYKMLI